MFKTHIHISEISYLIKFDEVSITISQSVQSEVQIIIFVLGLCSHHSGDALDKLIIHRVYEPREVRWIRLILNEIYVLQSWYLIHL